jgi:hypothetical protein
MKMVRYCFAAPGFQVFSRYFRRGCSPSLWLAVLLMQTAQLFAQVTVFSEDFEGSFPSGGGWTLGDDDPYGLPAYWNTVDSGFGGEGTHSGSRKAYCAGAGFGGTTNNPTYQSDMMVYMSRPINLGGLISASLSFWYKIPSIEQGSDFAQVFVDNTVVWSSATTVSTWTQASISLDAFVGGLHALKFEFVSDASTEYEGWYVDDILVTGTPGAGPPNDFFTNAVVLGGPSGTTNGSNLGATKEAGEPNHAGVVGGKSAWYRWTPSVSCTALFDTVGSAFNTVLAVYTGTNVGALTQVAANDDVSLSVLQSRLIFSATAGTTYRIAVDGHSGDSGSLVLNWQTFTGTPVNDAFSSAIALSGSSGSALGTNINATKQSSEPDHAGNAGGSSIWYRWTPAVGGEVTFNTLGSTFDTLLAVYTGNSLGSLSVVATNDDTSVSFVQSQVTFTAVAGTVYRIAVDGYGGAVGLVRLNWQQGKPVNDYFTNALVLNGFSGTVGGNNFNASQESGEPDHAGEVGGHSVWYRWTAPLSGSAAVDTAGSALDTLLAVYTGTQVSNLSLVAASHYAGFPPASRLTFEAAAGTVYEIAVDGFDNSQWTFQLNWRLQVPLRFTSISATPTNALITLVGTPGDHYEIQGSTNLPAWVSLFHVTNVTGTVQWLDSPATTQRARIFRAQLLAP